MSRSVCETLQMGELKNWCVGFSTVTSSGGVWDCNQLNPPRLTLIYNGRYAWKTWKALSEDSVWFVYSASVYSLTQHGGPAPSVDIKDSFFQVIIH